MVETRGRLGCLEEELQEQKQKMSDHMKMWEQKESEMEQQVGLHAASFSV